MKRLLKFVLGACVGALALSAFGNTAANAYIGTPQTQGVAGVAEVTCYQEYASNEFPGSNYWYCGSNEPVYKTIAGGALLHIGATGQSKLTANSVQFFVFANSAAFQTFCTGAVISPPNADPLIPNASPNNQCLSPTQLPQTDRGDSLVGGTFPYSVVVESDLWQPMNKTINENTPTCYIPFNSTHEFGHHEDKYLASVLGSSSYVTNSSQWNSMIAKDWTTINNKDVGNPVGLRNGCDNTGVSKLYISNQDQNGEFICAGKDTKNNLNGSGPGVNTAAKAGYTNSDTNQTILGKAWPTFYLLNAQAPTYYYELGASLFAASTGPTTVGPRLSSSTQDEGGSNGSYLNAFVCSKQLVQNLQLNGSKVLCQ